MKRVLSLVLVLVMVLGTIVPAFAEEATTTAAEMTAGEKLENYNVIDGEKLADGTTDLNEEGPITRAAMAVIYAQMNGVKADAEAYAFDSSFTDMEGHWAASYVAYAENEKWMVGGGPGTAFRPDADMTAAEVNVMLMKALGQTVVWETVTEDAAALGIAVDPADPTQVLRGEVFEAIVVALDETPVDATETLGTVLGLENYTAPVTEPVVVDLAIESVTALNAKQVEVKFNQEIVASTITATNVKVYLGATNTTTTTAYTSSVKEDGMTVVLGLTGGTMTQDTVVTVVAKDVENAAEEKLAATTLSDTLKDITAPAVLSAAFTSSKTLEIMTTEPLELEANAGDFHVLNNILVDGNKLVGKVTQDLDANKITVEFGAKVAVGEHTITVQNYTDFVKWLAPTVQLSAPVVADTTAPEITAVDANRGTVTVTFNEPVTTIGTVTIKATDYNDADATNASGDKMTWKITLDAGKELGLAELIAGEVSYYGATDVEGNIAGTAAAPVKFAFLANDDTTVPTATVALDANNNVIITFSEAVSDQGKITVTNSAGTVVKKDVVPTLKTAATYVYQVTAANAGLSTQATAANFTVNLKGFKDDSVRTNAGVAFDTAVISNDIVKPEVTNVILTEKGTVTNAAGTTQTADGTGTQVVGTGLVESKKASVTVYFSEAMDTATITDLSNYLIKIAGVELPGTSVTGLTATAAADAKSVVLSVPGVVNTAKTTYDTGIDSLDKIKVLLVKDAVGNTISTDATSTNITFNEEAAITNGPTDLAVAAIGGTAAYSAQTYALIEGNKLVVGFNNPITTLSPSDFTIYDIDDAQTVLVGINYTLSTSGKVATITLNGNLNSDGTYGASNHDVSIKIAKTNLTDIYGQKLALDQTQAFAAGMDYIAPTIKTVRVSGDTGAASKEIVLTFDEEVYASDALIKTDFKVMVNATTPYQLPIADYTVTSNGNKTISITIDDTTDIAGKTVTVELLNNRYLEDDNNGNDDYATALDNKGNVFAAMTVKNAAGTADFAIDTLEPTAVVDANIVITDEAGAADDTILLVNDGTAANTKWADSGLVDGDAITFVIGGETLTYTLQSGDMAKLSATTSITITVGTTTTGVAYSDTATAWDTAAAAAGTVAVTFVDVAGNTSTPYNETVQ